MENKNIAILVILGLLIVLSSVQAFQLNNLKGTMEETDVSVSANTPVRSNSGSSSAPASLPSSIKDLPQMVGGC